MTDAATDHSERVDARATTDASEPPDSAATVDAATLTEGAAVYQRLCSACHGADGRGRAGIGPAIDDEVREKSDRELRSLFERGEDRMPPVPMSNAEFVALISYLRSTFGAYQPED
jgi:mono/diheme cytochrome c family protein